MGDRLTVASGYEKRLVIEPGAGHCVVTEACAAPILQAMVLQGNFGDSTHTDSKVQCADKHDIMKEMNGGHVGWNTMTFGTSDIWKSGTSPCKPVPIDGDNRCAGPEIQCSRCFRACLVRKLFEHETAVLLEMAPAMARYMSPHAGADGHRSRGVAEDMAAYVRTLPSLVQMMFNLGACACKHQAFSCALTAARDISGCGNFSDPSEFERKAQYRQDLWPIDTLLGHTCDLAPCADPPVQPCAKAHPTTTTTTQAATPQPTTRPHATATASGAHRFHEWGYVALVVSLMSLL